MDAMIQRRVRDFRLDSRLRTTCESDIYTMCAFFGDLDSMEGEDASVIRCLQVSCFPACFGVLVCAQCMCRDRSNRRWDLFARAGTACGSDWSCCHARMEIRSVLFFAWTCAFTDT